MKLDKEQIEEFKSTGFLVIRGLYNAEEMKQITEWTEEVTNYPEVAGHVMMYFEQSKLEKEKRIISRIEDITSFHDGFGKLFLQGEIQQITSQLFDDDAVLFKDKINYKMPGADGFKAHQDIQAGWDRYSKLHITALVSIDASTLENGCLEVANGHNNEGIIGEQWAPLEEDALDYVALPTEPGDAVFFDSYAPHRSKPNMTDGQRRVLYVTYNAAAEGDHRKQYYDDKRLSYPPDIERDTNKEYVFRV